MTIEQIVKIANENGLIILKKTISEVNLKSRAGDHLITISAERYGGVCVHRSKNGPITHPKISEADFLKLVKPMKAAAKKQIIELQAEKEEKRKAEVAEKARLEKEEKSDTEVPKPETSKTAKAILEKAGIKEKDIIGTGEDGLITVKDARAAAAKKK